jgi:hypothetical protein
LPRKARASQFLPLGRPDAIKPCSPGSSPSEPMFPFGIREPPGPITHSLLATGQPTFAIGPAFSCYPAEALGRASAHVPAASENGATSEGGQGGGQNRVGGRTGQYQRDNQQKIKNAKKSTPRTRLRRRSRRNKSSSRSDHIMNILGERFGRGRIVACRRLGHRPRCRDVGGPARRRARGRIFPKGVRTGQVGRGIDGPRSGGATPASRSGSL